MAIGLGARGVAGRRGAVWHRNTVGGGHGSAGVATQRRRWLLWALLLALLGPASVVQPARADDNWQTTRQRLVTRALMSTNALRGLSYLPRYQPGAGPDAPSLSVNVRRRIALTGDPVTNVRGNVYPIDVDGDGRYELVQYNGYRFIRVFDQDGNKLWERDNPSGRAHRSFVHRDTMAIVDSDGDGAQEIFQCWSEPGVASKELLVRDGATGDVIRTLRLDGDPADEECQIAGFKMAGVAGPVILVSRHDGTTGGCLQKHVDQWSGVTAYDVRLRPLWTRSACEAGHYVWPLDVDQDGVAEAVFVGKYKISPAGDLLCTLSGWGNDHVDSLLVADVDRTRPGLEAIAVGSTGTRAYDASSCQPLWSLPDSRIHNPQVVQAAMLGDGSNEPAVFIEQKNGSPKHSWRLSGRGTGLVQLPIQHHYQTANLDGSEGAEDRVGQYGMIFDAQGRKRLSTDWLQQLDAQDGVPRGVKMTDRWTFNPLVFDLDGDGQDELIIWGRDQLVIAEVGRPAAAVIAGR
jgi:hypothetical protein